MGASIAADVQRAATAGSCRVPRAACRADVVGALPTSLSVVRAPRYHALGTGLAALLLAAFVVVETLRIA